ncbi:MAG: hypothetical protein AAF430_01290 [Myxococcota bacterium]
MPNTLPRRMGIWIGLAFVAVFSLGAGPWLRDLFDRVDRLEAIVEALDQSSIVVDDNDRVIGPVIDYWPFQAYASVNQLDAYMGPGSTRLAAVIVSFEPDGFIPMPLQVSGSRSVDTPNVHGRQDVGFETIDCSGDPMIPGSRVETITPGYVRREGSEKMLFGLRRDTEPERVTILSVFSSYGRQDRGRCNEAIRPFATNAYRMSFLFDLQREFRQPIRTVRAADLVGLEVEISERRERRRPRRRRW